MSYYHIQFVMHSIINDDIMIIYDELYDGRLTQNLNNIYKNKKLKH